MGVSEPAIIQFRLISDICVLFRFTTPHHKEGFELFLDTIVSMEDVWVVTAWQAIQWMRDPTPLEDIETFKPFQCDYKVRPNTVMFHQ